ncbi:hypothetical protein [Isoptericola sp. NPDC057191]|uniref:hypothetical protein n=1 Tax=Isoptericola sp. NPDC057191 TaxID=3346041 RepID=UPI00363FE076
MTRPRAVAAAARTLSAALAVGALLAAASPVAEAQGARAAVVKAAVPGDRGDEPGGVALSLDGRRWTDGLDTALFTGEPWVPGETRRAVLLVRNDGPGAARARVAAALGGRPEGPAAALADALRVRVRPAGGDWAEAGRPAAVRLAEAQVLPVALEVTLAPSAGNEVQGASVPVDVVVTLAGEADAGGGTDGTDGGDGAEDPDGADGVAGGGGADKDGDVVPPGDVPTTGVLPRTGGVGAGLAVIAVLAVAAGALLRVAWARGGGDRA